MIELKRYRESNYFAIRLFDGEGFQQELNLTLDEAESLRKQLQLQLGEMQINKEA